MTNVFFPMKENELYKMLFAFAQHHMIIDYSCIYVLQMSQCFRTSNVFTNSSIRLFKQWLRYMQMSPINLRVQGTIEHNLHLYLLFSV